MENGDRGWRGLYQAGGIGMIAAGLLVLVTLPLIPTLIPSLAPATVQSGLESIQSQRLLFGTTWGLYLVSDLLYLVPFPALFVVLRQHTRAAALIALIFNSLFVTIDVGVDIPLRLSLIGLSNSYASANPAGQAAYVATAQLAMDLANIAALSATLWHDRAHWRALLARCILPAAIGAGVVIAVGWLAVGWNIPLTLWATARRWTDIQKNFDMNRPLWYLIGLPIFLLFLSPGLWTLSGLALRRPRLRRTL